MNRFIKRESDAKFLVIFKHKSYIIGQEHNSDLASHGRFDLTAGTASPCLILCPSSPGFFTEHHDRFKRDPSTENNRVESLRVPFVGRGFPLQVNGEALAMTLLNVRPSFLTIARGQRSSASAL